MVTLAGASLVGPATGPEGGTGVPRSQPASTSHVPPTVPTMKRRRLGPPAARSGPQSASTWVASMVSSFAIDG